MIERTEGGAVAAVPPPRGSPLRHPSRSPGAVHVDLGWPHLPRHFPACFDPVPNKCRPGSSTAALQTNQRARTLPLRRPALCTQRPHTAMFFIRPCTALAALPFSHVPSPVILFSPLSSSSIFCIARPLAGPPCVKRTHSDIHSLLLPTARVPHASSPLALP